MTRRAAETAVREVWAARRRKHGSKTSYRKLGYGWSDWRDAAVSSWKECEWEKAELKDDVWMSSRQLMLWRWGVETVRAVASATIDS